MVPFLRSYHIYYPRVQCPGGQLWGGGGGGGEGGGRHVTL